MTENIREKVDNLEAKVAFQDDTIDELNSIITEHEQRIYRLEAAFKQLSNTVSAAGLDINAGNEKPPHY